MILKGGLDGPPVPTPVGIPLRFYLWQRVALPSARSDLVGGLLFASLFSSVLGLPEASDDFPRLYVPRDHTQHRMTPESRDG